jgi:hypothetical protein
MPAALYNLMIAEQYIDETKSPAEYKLVCFHYGVALLAAYRNDPVKRHQAGQYLATAAGWQAGKGEDQQQKAAIDRIVSESQYNLGVIDELDGEYENVLTHYDLALKIAERPDRAGSFDAARNFYTTGSLDNVTVVAKLGRISCEKELICGGQPTSRTQAGATSTTPAVPSAEISPELKTRIEATLKMIIDLKSLLDRLQSKEPGMSQAKQDSPEPPKSWMRRFLNRVSPGEKTRGFVRAQSANPVATLRKLEIMEALESRLKEFDHALKALLPRATGKQE